MSHKTVYMGISADKLKGDISHRFGCSLLEGYEFKDVDFTVVILFL